MSSIHSLFLEEKKDGKSFCCVFLTKPKRAGSTAGPEPCIVLRLTSRLFGGEATNEFTLDFMCPNCAMDQFCVFLVKVLVFFLLKLTIKPKSMDRAYYVPFEVKINLTKQNKQKKERMKTENRSVAPSQNNLRCKPQIMVEQM